MRSPIRLLRTVAYAAAVLALGCARPAPTAPEKTAVYESPLSPTADPIDVGFESVEPRPAADAPEPPHGAAEPTSPEAEKPAQESETSVAPSHT